MTNRRKEDEMPISPKPDSPVPEIFSSKKIFFLNSSYSESRRSEIPRVDSDFCPRDEVSRRLFHEGGNSCDCDCSSDGCWGCLRRNKQCFFKFFVLALSIALILLLFGSLSYNLTRNKVENDSPESVRTEWVSHYHEFSALEERHLPTKKDAASLEPTLNVPVPVYEHSEDYDSEENVRELQHSLNGEIQPFSLPFLNAQNLRDEILIIYDEREPTKTKRSVSSDSKQRESFKGIVKPRRDAEPDYEAPIFEELNEVEEGMEKFWEIYFKKGRTVFQPFSLTTPFQTNGFSPEEQFFHEPRTGVVSQAVENFDSLTKMTEMMNVKEVTEMDEVTRGEAATDVSELSEMMSDGKVTDENWSNETAEASEAEKNEEFTVIGPASVERETAPNQSLRSFAVSDNSNLESVKEVDESATVQTEMVFAEENGKWEEIASTEASTLKETDSEEENSPENSDASKQIRTWPLFHFSAPLSGLFGSSQRDPISADPAPLDTVKGISLADAKKIKKERRKHTLLNSRVVGGSSDVGLPTGPDISKPFLNAFETLKTNQQLSFTPSAASQFILPYQMCLFGGSLPAPRPPPHVAQPRTFSFGTPPFAPSFFDKTSPPKPPYQAPSQQNILSFSINNYPNAPPPRQLAQPSGASTLNFHQFPQFPAPNRQPIFCTYLQPPLFQFPTVPGTADFSHAKCVDCQEDSPKHSLPNKQLSFSSGRETLCAENKVPCADGSGCVAADNWCDNRVHCKDASDEAFCSCRERVARDRICDGYFDCPRGEDETGCFDCPKTAFSCDSVISPESCIPLSKRCDGVRDCSTGADEADCSALFLHGPRNDSHHVPQVNGYLHRNWKGDWFPVCVEIGENLWAQEACSGELGALSSDAEVRYAPVSVWYRGPFIVRREDGVISLQDHCKGHVSTYVKCPPMKCGTRIEHRFSQDPEKSYFGDKLRRNVRAGYAEEKLRTKLKFRFAGSQNLRPKREETGRVVGGRESQPKAWPWAIAVYKNGAFHCGGVILDENWVLTAAHCMEQYWMHYYEVRGGMLRRFSFSAMEQVRTVSHVIIHENYDFAIMSNDLALLRLRESFQFNRWLRPACLPVLQDGVSKFVSGPAPGTRCTAVGWGALKERGTDPDQLREVEIPILMRCKHKEDLMGEEICAGKAEGGKDTCQGDSGGPLLCRDSGSPSSWYVAGIVSHGEGCARPGEPGAYTRISLFVDWITANTNDFQLLSVRPLQKCPGFRCRTASKLCIPRKWVCNGYTDCLEAEDEKNCTSEFESASAFNRPYPGEFKHFDREEEQDTNFGKKPASEESVLAALFGNTSMRKTNEKEKMETLHEEENPLQSLTEGTTSGGTEKFFDDEVISTTKGFETPLFTFTERWSTATPSGERLSTSGETLWRSTQESTTAADNLTESLQLVECLPKTEPQTESVPINISEKNENHRKTSPEKIKNVQSGLREEEEERKEKKAMTGNVEVDAAKEGLPEYEKATYETLEDLSETEEKTGKIQFEEEKKIKKENEKVFGHYGEAGNVAVTVVTDRTKGSERERKQQTNIMQIENDQKEKSEEVLYSEENEEKGEGNEKQSKETEEKTSTEEYSDEKNEEETNKKVKEENIKEKKENTQFENFERRLSTDFQEILSTTVSIVSDFPERITAEILSETDGKKEFVLEVTVENLEAKEVQTETNSAETAGMSFATVEAVGGWFPPTPRTSLITESQESEPVENFEVSTLKFLHRSLRTLGADQTYPDVEEYSTSSLDLKTTFYPDDATATTQIGGRNPGLETSHDSEYFRCRLIVQSILGQRRCDGFADCEDGTDEENCFCADALLRLNPDRICNGRVDCPDGSDEKNCSQCPEGRFLCGRSRECISLWGRCNGVDDCESGEDEADCLALAPGGRLRMRPDGEPLLETEGVLMVNREGIWEVQCQERGSAMAAGEAIEVCASLGTIGYEKYENRSVSTNCTGFHVTCANILRSSGNEYRKKEGKYLWPWNAFVYSDGSLACSAVLLRPRWLLTSSQCLRGVSLKKNYLAAKLGDVDLSPGGNEAGVQTIRIDGAHLMPDSEAVLLHLSKEAEQIRSVRVLGIPYAFDSDPDRDYCVAVGDRTLFLKTSERCPETSRCFSKIGHTPPSCRSRPWIGVVVCQSKYGWYPASVFSEKSGRCGFQRANFTNLQDQLKFFYDFMDEEVDVFPEPPCSGFRCSQGLCISQSQMCDGLSDCPFDEDESYLLCRAKKGMKECEMTELKCRNGRCIPKVLFGDGKNDCGDESDEPENKTCAEYLRLTAPERICDGRRNCYDKTDEDHRLCSCEGQKFHCRSGHCIPKDFVCDREKDCPGGDDEERCLDRKIVKNKSEAYLEIMQNSYGVWHPVCFGPASKADSDALCKGLGFGETAVVFDRNQTVLVPEIDAFSWVKLNRITSLGLRGNKPFVKLVAVNRTCSSLNCA